MKPISGAVKQDLGAQSGLSCILSAGKSKLQVRSEIFGRLQKKAYHVDNTIASAQKPTHLQQLVDSAQRVHRASRHDHGPKAAHLQQVSD